MSEATAKNPPSWSRTKTRPVRLIIFFGLVALGVRFGLPSSDPFALYFEQYLKTGGQGRGHAAAARIAQLGERGIEGLQAILEDPQATGKELGAAMRLAGEIGAPELAGRLLELAGAGQPLPIRLAALEGIGSMGGTDAVPVLLESLADENPEIRIAALHAVGRADASDLVAQVESLATSGSGEERPEALAALGRLGSAQARASLWRIYSSGPLGVPEAGAARAALAKYPQPDKAERAALLAIAEGYLPVHYVEPSRRARDRLETSLRTLLAIRIEDVLLGESEGNDACEGEIACAQRNKYYRDLIRRRSTLEIEGDTFIALRADAGAKSEPLQLVRARWILGDSMRRRVRYQSLSLVRMIGEQPAVFPVRELGYSTFAEAGEAEIQPELGRILRVSGRLGSNNLVVSLAVPTAGVLLEERYRFEGGVFVPISSNEFQ